MTASHSHSAADASAFSLKLVLVLTASYMLIEVVAGVITGSLALIADAGHMLTDVAGVSMSLLAIWFGRRPATPLRTYGYYRLEILAALANGLLLLGVSGYILFEAYRRFSDPPEILGEPMLAVASVGLLINLTSAYLLFEGQKSSLNMKGAFLEVVSDLVGSSAVIVAGAVILLTGFELVDPIASVFIGLFILPRTWHLMGSALHVLLEGTPKRLNVNEVRQHILTTDGVEGVHDLHIWTLTSGLDAVSAHVVIGADANAERVLDELCACLDAHFDIEHSTFQLEGRDRSQLEPLGH